MAMLYRHYGIDKEVADTLTRMGVPFRWQQGKNQKFDLMHDSVKLNSVHSSKGLRFPPVYMSTVGEDQVLEGKARLLYVAYDTGNAMMSWCWQRKCGRRWDCWKKFDFVAKATNSAHGFRGITCFSLGTTTIRR